MEITFLELVIVALATVGAFALAIPLLMWIDEYRSNKRIEKEKAERKKYFTIEEYLQDNPHKRLVNINDEPSLFEEMYHAVMEIQHRLQVQQVQVQPIPASKEDTKKMVLEALQGSTANLVVSRDYPSVQAELTAEETEAARKYFTE
ncbi:hypothetical protein ABID22_000110 [Pontibacter aydingkolensis]|uniref:Uncharacterized protein n=1 Tax=Pontibacter aydingkolensis TaxID=1911536 RepID=A0ABS7CQV7_9BACT|nr:hypothetical protein [Pontibacter aydingkolensis]MBW7466220.1 hypothetical protein [Pontibacter aydingkolensis]